MRLRIRENPAISRNALLTLAKIGSAFALGLLFKNCVNESIVSCISSVQAQSERIPSNG